MLNVFKTSLLRNFLDSSYTKTITRKFLSPSYYCNGVWESRLSQPIFQRINLDELYFELDQHYQKTKHISFIDVDIFANAITDNSYDDEMMDLVHKLRLTSETSSSLPSMSYAVIKNLLKNNKIEELHSVLDDRLNYGVFLDNHTSNIALDYFWKKKDFVSGVRIASQSMLQEDPYHPITDSFSLLHCYNCLLNKGQWSPPPLPEQPVEEVKVRVKYVRNEYDDQHFDLRDSQKIIGKTLIYLTKQKNDSVSNSFFILGACLFGDSQKAEDKLNESEKNKIPLIREILQLLPEDSDFRRKLEKIPLISEDVSNILESNVNKAVKEKTEEDIAMQCELFKKWEQKRLECLQEKEEMLNKIERIKKIETLQKELEEKQTRLWFFENEEKIELEIQEKEELKANEITDEMFFGKAKKQASSDDYIPPQIRK